MTTLYKRDHKGNLRFWTITTDDDELTVEFGQVGGESQVHTEIVEANSVRDEYEQLELKVQSKINSKLKKGYVADKEYAKYKADTNILGFSKPMKAILLKNVKSEIDYDRSFFQYKYNGHRCMIINVKGELKAYSSGGKPITTIQHILSHIRIPEGATIDGELYCHGHSLQTISSWIKRLQPDTLRLRFHCYDVVSPAEYEERLSMLQSYSFGDHAVLVPTFKFEHSVKEMLEDSILHGYEGIMIRLPEFGYEDGKRSKGIVKVKKYLDDEFEVVDILESKDGWAKLRCKTKEGKIFGCACPGAMPFKTYVWNNKAKFIGKSVRVEFPEWTDDKKPAQPVAVMFRDKESE